MKKIIKHIIFNRPFAKLLIKPVLRMHSASYKWAGLFSTVLNAGIHPKHHILKYKEWFLQNVEQGWTVLDIGCNTGQLTAMLAEKCKFVYGIEVNNDHVKIASRHNARNNIEYICADATAYDFQLLQPINCIIMSNVLEHIKNRVDFLKTTVSRVKWADNNRKLFLRVPAIDREWIVLYKKELGLDYRLDSTHQTEYTLKQLSEELEQAGIKIGKSETRFGEIYAICKVL